MNNKIEGLTSVVLEDTSLSLDVERIQAMLKDTTGVTVGAVRGDDFGTLNPVVEGLFSAELSRVATMDDVKALLVEEPEFDDCDTDQLMPTLSKRISDNTIFSVDLPIEKLGGGVLTSTTEVFLGKNKIAEMSARLVDGVPDFDGTTCKIFGKDVDLNSFLEFKKFVVSLDGVSDIDDEFQDVETTGAKMDVINRIAAQLDEIQE